MTIREVVEMVTDENVSRETIATTLIDIADDFDNMVTECDSLKAVVESKDVEIDRLKDSNYELMKRAIDRPVKEVEEVEEVEENIKIDDIFE